MISWLKSARNVVVASLGVRRAILGLVIVALASRYEWLRNYLNAHGLVLPDISGIALFLIVGLGYLLFHLLKHAIELNERTKPRLEFSIVGAFHELLVTSASGNGDGPWPETVGVVTLKNSSLTETIADIEVAIVERDGLPMRVRLRRNEDSAMRLHPGQSMALTLFKVGNDFFNDFVMADPTEPPMDGPLLLRGETSKLTLEACGHNVPQVKVSYYVALSDGDDHTFRLLKEENVVPKWELRKIAGGLSPGHVEPRGPT